MIFGKNARTNNDMIPSKYVISYVGEYVRKNYSLGEQILLTTCTSIHAAMGEKMHEGMLVCPMLVEQLGVSMEV